LSVCTDYTTYKEIRRRSLAYLLGSGSAGLGKNGKVLTDVIPELEILIGPQPEVKHLPPVEALNRFHDLFDRFLTCLANEENPLTLFIDDLQWCDTATFDFLANLFANYKDHPYLFLLGAYRHNEVDSSHPLSKLIRNARDANQPLKEIMLDPLKPEHCHEMVSYILDSPLPQTKALSKFISVLTEGNPLFVSESLSYLYNEDLLYLDNNRQWLWDIDKIRQSNMPTSVVALFSSKIQKLPSDLISLLEYCACMGNTFSPTELSLIREMTLLQTFEMLKPALGQGLLIESKNQLQFIHDKVQEAALSTIPPERRREIHRQIGDHLLATVMPGRDLKSLPIEAEKLDNLFTIVSHLNLGREEEPDKKTAYLLSDLNYHAGNKALSSLATEAANEYFNISRELLPDDCWDDDHYERTFKVFQKAAKTELMCGNYESSERLLNYLLDCAKTDLDKAECLAEQTTSLSSIGNFIKAIETANRGLAYFGKAIPDDPKEADRRRAELMAEIASKDFDVWETILNMPFTTDRKSKIELAFYSELIPDLYMSGLVPQLYLSAAQSTQNCLSGGMDESVIYSFSIMGLHLGEQEELEQAFRYEDLARDLSAKYPNTFGATRGMNGIVWCNMHSRSRPRVIVDYCQKSIQCGKNCGDLYNAGLSYGPLMWNLQVQGADLSVIEDYAAECLQFSNRYHLSFSVGLAEAMQAGWIDPMKKDYLPVSMDEKLKQWEADNHVASAGSYYVHIGLAHYYFGEYEKAQEYLIGVRRYLTGLTDNVLKRQWHVFLVLNALKLYEKGVGHRSKDELLAEIHPIIKKIEQWASLGPLLKPYLAFLYAELERVTGDFKEARGLYLDAINTAYEEDYTFLEGHLNECLGELMVQAGHGPKRPYFVEAARLYRKCRAERKEISLLDRHPDCFEEEQTFYQCFEAELSSSSLSSTLPNLDVEYLMKSSLVISDEIEHEILLKKIMKIIIESSGAQNAYLLIGNDEGLYVCAESNGLETQVEQALTRRLEDSEGICKAIVRYVYRTGETVVLANACQEGMFKDNQEVQDTQLRSVLCMPVFKMSKMMGILFLENRLADSVFTPRKTQIMELLMSQTAISTWLMEDLKKVQDSLRKSYDELEKRVQERTTELAMANKVLGEEMAERKRIEKELAEQHRQGLERLAEIEKIQRLTIGRELKMMDLKKEIDDLRKETDNLKKQSL
ncbi:MAG: GAF domain-containing protein, partial [Armatimonadetes bacterium]|nr:GAF domain-containing protein [Armatimonadota bacterium]